MRTFAAVSTKLHLSNNSELLSGWLDKNEVLVLLSGNKLIRADHKNMSAIENTISCKKHREGL